MKPCRGPCRVKRQQTEAGDSMSKNSTELLNSAYEAFEERNYEDARLRFQQVVGALPADSFAAEIASRYLHHLQQSNLELLQKLSNATEREEQWRLLREALEERQLEFDLHGNSLAEHEAQLSEHFAARVEEWFDEARIAFEESNYEHARELYQKLDKAFVNPEIRDEAERFLLHLEQENLELLQEIASAEDDPSRREALLNEALQRGLSFDLKQQPLHTLFEQLQRRRTIEADNQAQNLLDEGLDAVESGNLQLAREKYEAAADISNLSSGMRRTIAARLDKLADLEKDYAKAESVLSSVENFLESAEPDYALALEQLNEARVIFPTHPRISSLRERVVEGRQSLERIQGLLKEGWAALRDDRLQEALAHFQEAQESADSLGLAAQAQEARKGLEEVERAFEAQRDRFMTAWQEGEEYLANNDFAAALERLQEARNLALPGTDITELDRLLDETRESEELASLKERARRQLRDFKDFDTAARTLEQARQLAPDDEEVAGLLDEAQKLGREARTVRQTIGLRRVPFRSPQEVEEAFQPGGIFDRYFRGDELAEMQRRVPELYWQQAASDLRNVVENKILTQVEQGNLSQTIAEGEKAYEEWYDYFERESRIREQNRALEARLEILKAQLNDLRQGQDIATLAAAQIADIEEAFEAENDNLALNRGREAWDELSKADERLDYVLSSLRRSLAASLYLPLQRQVQQHYGDLSLLRSQALSQLHSNHLEEAYDTVQRGERHVARLGELHALHEQTVTPTLPTAEWQIPPVEDDWQTLARETSNALRWQNWLKEARLQVDQGNYRGAVDTLSMLLEEGASSSEWAAPLFKEAKTLRNGVGAAIEHRQRLDAALAQADEKPHYRADYDEAIKALQEIDHLLGETTWTAAQKEAVQQHRHTYQAAMNLVEAAESYFQSHSYQRAWEEAERVLKEYPTLVAATLKAEQIKSKAEAGRQAIESLKRWQQEAGQALRQGAFEEALVRARQVLEVRPDDPIALRIQRQAEKGQRLRNEATDELADNSIEALLAAEQKLSDALVIAYDSEELRQQREEIRRRRIARQGPETSLEQAQRALKAGDWTGALELALEALPADEQPDIKVQLEALRDKASERLNEVVRQHIINEEATLETLKEAQTALVFLQENRLVEARTRELEGQLARQIVVTSATLQLEAMKVQAALQELRSVEDEYGDRSDFAAVYNTAIFLHDILMAREVLKGEANESTLTQAIALLAQANQHRRRVNNARRWEERAGLPSQETTHLWQKRLEEQLALLQVHQCVNQGQLSLALEKLNALPITPETQVLRQEIETIKTYMDQAALWDGSTNDIKAAMKALNHLLPPQQNPAYAPAEKRREEILTTLLRRIEERVRSNEIDQMANALEIYALLLSFDPPDSNRLETEQARLETRLRQKLRELSGQVRNALENADLTHTQCQELLAAVERVPIEWRQKYSTLKNAEQEIEKRLAEIAQVDGYVQRARNQLSQAHEEGSYGRIAGFLQRAIQVNSSIFSSRSEIAHLQHEITLHQARRNQIEEQIRPQYQVVKRIVDFNFSHPTSDAEQQVWRRAQRDHFKRLQVEATHETILPESLYERDSVATFVNWGIGWLATAADISQDWQKSDPQNLYALRNWNPASNTEDPLLQAYHQFRDAQQNLQQIGASLQGALEIKREAERELVAVQGLSEKAGHDDDYERIIERYQSIIDNQKAAERLLSNLPVAESRWAEVLRKRSEELCKALTTARDQAEDDQERIIDLRERVNTARDVALNQQRQCDNSDPACWKLAIDCWNDVLNLTEGRNQDAAHQIASLQTLIQAHEQRQRSRQLVSGAGFFGVILLALLSFAWSAKVGPFAAQPTPTPTVTGMPTPFPTLTATIVLSPTPSSTPTITPEPTLTPTQTSTPTETPPPSPTPQVCQVTAGGWMRERASDDSVGLKILNSGSQILVFDRVDDGGTSWYLIQDGLQQSGYIRAVYVSCPDTP